MDTNYPTFETIQAIREKLRDAEMSHWIHHDIYTVNFIILFVLAIVPWVIWWKVVKKSRIFEILTFGLLLGLISVILDSVGTNMLFWGYKDQLFGISPPLFPADISLMSVPFMYVFQKFHQWKSFVLASVGIALVYAYIGETILQWLNIYELDSWKHTYSLPIYAILPVLCRWVVLKLQRTTG